MNQLLELISSKEVIIIMAEIWIVVLVLMLMGYLLVNILADEDDVLYDEELIEDEATSDDVDLD